MALVKFKRIDGVADPNIESNYTEAAMTLIDDRKRVAQYDDVETGAQIILFGENFKYDGGSLVSGKVEQVQFSTFEGEVFATAVNIKISAAKINDLLLGDFGATEFVPRLFDHDDTFIGRGNGIADFIQAEPGNDILKGKSGDDVLVGNAGNDTMAGGVGNDVFQFFGDLGKDVITDFNVGDEVNFDLIFIRNSEFSLGQTSDGDLKIKFGAGAQVILEGVDFADRNDVHFDAVL